MGAIYRKELRSYFTTMIGYIYSAIFLVIVGLYFTSYNMKAGYAKFEYVLSAIEFLYIILIPILTMRLIAEENKQKTDQLLLTAPISIGRIVLGKYFAAITMFLVPVVLMIFYPVIISFYGTVDFASTYTTLFGFVLLGATYMALGLFVSAITENQVIALILTAILILISYIMPGIVNLIPNDSQTAWLVLSVIVLILCLVSYLVMHNSSFTLGFGLLMECILTSVYLFKPSLYEGIVEKVFNCFSISEKFTDFTYGILSVNGIVYFLSVIIMFVMLTIQMIKKRRWS